MTLYRQIATFAFVFTVMITGPANATDVSEGAASRSFCASGAWRGEFGETDTTCVTSRFGVIIAPAAEATALAAVVDEAGDRYGRFFNRPMAAVAIVAGGAVSAKQTTFLKTMGYDALPWLTGAQRRQITEATVRAQVKAQLPDLADAAVSSAVAAALARMPTAGGPTERGALAHEIGHLWFRALFDRRRPQQKAESRSYGSSAPDWLDEMAAVLCENGDLTVERRASLAKLANGSGDDGLYPLGTFLTMPHPSLNAVAMARPTSAKPDDQLSLPAGGGSRVRVLSGKEADAFMGTVNPARFYTQARGFADFLIDRTGDRMIFHKVAMALAGGKTFEQWLAGAGASTPLPKSLAGLEEEWVAWAKRDENTSAISE